MPPVEHTHREIQTNAQVELFCSSLQSKVRKALELEGVLAIVERIQTDLKDAVLHGQVFLPEGFLKENPEKYARHLLYRDAQTGVTAVVMTWAPGQATPLHDHAGMWCVEAVVQGEMTVTRYELTERRGEMAHLVERERLHANVGSSGCLIPPLEHHVMANLSPLTAITLHVYEKELDTCEVFLPQSDGWYSCDTRHLTYN